MKPVLLVVDVQKGMDEPTWGIRNNIQAEEKMLELLNVWRKNELPIIHVQHVSQNPESPLHPSYPGFQLKTGFEPKEDEYFIRKKVNSCFIGTNLDNYLKNNGYQTLIVIGLTSNHCISSTVRMAGNLGYRTYVCSDATAAFETTSYDGVDLTADEVHRHALSSLHQEFAEVVTTNNVISMIESIKKNV
ncbi:cysteine hydrolase family protein [Sutcliffiella rhizosphaerae]|uniref:Streptothricin hydrolase n=1 Tax=Sutcliffiella rhizosphaerae TaxID=2880967 RepID=A0ABM8YPJ2_9BACI|nr:cysteine hydrolase family protein [Sutcliffiella rhizosphaerae]CAG9621908.1 Streptothricin hydrolase [Sutcliffiella rhizosphaerae]